MKGIQALKRIYKCKGIKFILHIYIYIYIYMKKLLCGCKDAPLVGLAVGSVKKKA